MSIGVVIFGTLAFIAGLVMLVIAIRRRGDGEDPRMNALLIGGMMVTAFGLLIAGFSIGFATADPLPPPVEATS